MVAGRPAPGKARRAMVSTGWPLQLATRKQVQMQMEHGLARPCTLIGHQTVGRDNSQARRRLLNRTDQCGCPFGRQVLKARNMVPGNHEDMRGCLGIQVGKGHRVGVFMDEGSRDLSRHNPAEDARCIVVGHAGAYRKRGDSTWLAPEGC